MRVAWLQRA